MTDNVTPIGEAKRRQPRSRKSTSEDDLPPVNELNLEGFRCTDLGNAERLVERYRGQLRYCYGRKKWLIWGGKRWVWDESGSIQRMAKTVVRSIYGEAEHCADEKIRQAIAAHARKSEKAGSISAMISLAESEKGVPVGIDELDNDPMLFNCENGTLNLATGVLLEHSKDHLITNVAGCRYEPSKTHPILERYLEGVTRGNKELRQYIQRAVGYSLLGKMVEKALFFVHGPGDSAKSTFLEAFAAMLGSYHESADEATWVAQGARTANRGDLVRLAGKRVVTTIEFQKGSRFDESLMKKATGGGDAMAAAAKYEKEITFTPQFALWFAANDVPKIRSDDGAFWNRLKLIPFTYSIPKADQDKSIRAILTNDQAARSAMLSWAVEGFTAWQRDGLGTAAVVEESVKTCQDAMDPLVDFFADRLEFHPDLSTTPAKLRSAYETWAKEEGVKFTVDRKRFEEAVSKSGGEYKKDAFGTRIVRGVAVEIFQ